MNNAQNEKKDFFGSLGTYLAENIKPLLECNPCWLVGAAIVIIFLIHIFEISFFGFNVIDAFLFLILFVGIVLMYGYYQDKGEKLAKSWFDSIDYIVEEPDACPANFVGDKWEQVEKGRICAQLDELKRRARFHITVYKYFFVNYFIFLRMATYTAVIAGLCLLEISMYGWIKTSGNIKAIFLVMFCTSTIFTALMRIFGLDKNMNDNKALLGKYIGLLHELSSYAATGEDLGGQKKEPKVFIHYLDTQMQALNSLAVGFDVSQLPDYKKIMEGLKESTAFSPSPKV